MTGGAGQRDFIGFETGTTISGRLRRVVRRTREDSLLFRSARGRGHPLSGRHHHARHIARRRSFRDEIYDLGEGDKWVLDAPIYGIPFGAKYCSAFVELPDDYRVWPAYRQFLRLKIHVAADNRIPESEQWFVKCVLVCLHHWRLATKVAIAYV